MGNERQAFRRPADADDRRPSFRHEAYGTSAAAFAPTARDAVHVISATLGAGDISCAAAPNLVFGVIHDRPTVTADFGAGRFTRRMTTRAGILIPPGIATEAYAQQAHRVKLFCIGWSYVLSLAEDTVLPADGSFGALHSGPLGPSAGLDILDRIDAEASSGNVLGGLFLDGAVMTLVATLAALARAPLRHASGGLAAWQVRRTTEYLSDRIAEPVTLAELAAIARLSPFHFARAFKSATGDPPHRYHTRLRIDRAKEMLERTDLSVTEIAAAVGYDSSQSLARAFREGVGSTPSKWRRDRWS